MNIPQVLEMLQGAPMNTEHVHDHARHNGGTASESDIAYFVNQKWKDRLIELAAKTLRMMKLADTMITKHGRKEDEKSTRAIVKYIELKTALYRLFGDIWQMFDPKVDIKEDLLNRRIDTSLPIFKRIFSVADVRKVTELEIRFYDLLMTRKIFSTLEEECNETERVEKVREEMFNKVEELWNDNISEENILNYLLHVSRQVYPRRSPTYHATSAQTWFLQLTGYRDVRVSLSEDQIKRLKRKKGTSGCCSTCQEDYDAEQTMVSLPCRHVFHEDCIVPWLRRRVTCPICRFDVRKVLLASKTPKV